VDAGITTIGKAGMAFARIIGVVLDNLIPGRAEERDLKVREEAGYAMRPFRAEIAI